MDILENVIDRRIFVDFRWKEKIHSIIGLLNFVRYIIVYF